MPLSRRIVNAHAISSRRTLTREAKHNVCAQVSYFLGPSAYTFCDLGISGLLLVEPLSVHFQRFQIENVNLTCATYAHVIQGIFVPIRKFASLISVFDLNPYTSAVSIFQWRSG